MPVAVLPPRTTTSVTRWSPGDDTAGERPTSSLRARGRWRPRAAPAMRRRAERALSGQNSPEVRGNRASTAQPGAAGLESEQCTRASRSISGGMCRAARGRRPSADRRRARRRRPRARPREVPLPGSRPSICADLTAVQPVRNGPPRSPPSACCVRRGAGGELVGVDAVEITTIAATLNQVLVHMRPDVFAHAGWAAEAASGRVDSLRRPCVAMSERSRSSPSLGRRCW